MIDELSKKRKVEHSCMEFIHKYMKRHKPEIRPYGKLKKHGDGFTVWGEHTENGRNINRLYYVDILVMAVWRGNRIGWRRINDQNDVKNPGTKSRLDINDYLERIRTRKEFKKCKK